MRISILTTVWERPLITQFHIRWMNQFKQMCLKELGIYISPFYVLSKNDRHLTSFITRLNQHGHDYTINDIKTLSNKSQAGLDALRRCYNPDWLMHLDSDEILSKNLMRRWIKEMKKGRYWFGSRSCYFFDVDKKKFWEFTGYNDYPVKNGGTCLSRELLDTCDWEIWPKGKDQGLNYFERRHIMSKCDHMLIDIDMQDEYGVVEIKGGDNAIHSLSWFEKTDSIVELEQEQQNAILQAHPMLRLFY